MSNLIVLSGFPGSGKSTYARNELEPKGYKIFSSDQYREKLLGDWKDQSANANIFQALYKDLREHLKNGQDAVLDATNINRKERARVIDQFGSLANISCIFFATDPEICLGRCIKRDECKVWDDYKASYVKWNGVINKFLRKFEIPFIGEGFTEVTMIQDVDSEYEYKTFEEMMDLMKGFDQNNPHHKLNLYDHCMKTYNNYLSDGLSVSLELAYALQLHDIGKWFTKSVDERTGYYHFFDHDKYGAYISLFIDYGLNIDRYKVALFINYHDTYKLDDMNAENRDRLIKQFKAQGIWDILVKIREADEGAAE